MENKVELFSESGSLNGHYDSFKGTVKTVDGVEYSRKELKTLFKQNHLTGEPLSRNQHLAKKIFGGELVEYQDKPKASMKQAKKNGGHWR